MKISETKAIVTGGASGLGEATVREIVAGGGRACIFDVQEERGRALAAELGEAVHFCRVDVTDEASVSAGIAEAAAAMGGLNVAVNCAGIAIAAKILGRDGPHPLDAYRRVIDVNLTGTFNVSRLAVAQMAGNAPNADGERGVVVM
ncbi:MAG: SDR family NAD(P)-dependent oxidoreductase, partial [Alphaproteobacteria bacterium]